MKKTELALKINKLIHDKCKDVPHDIGMEVMNLVELLYEPEPDSEPYFGWCDVEGCDNEGCCGGSVWKDTGYWTACYKHSDAYRKGESQPKMKDSAILREMRRSPEGILSE